jgi:F-box and WD-40 domain protein CDC4
MHLELAECVETKTVTTTTTTKRAYPGLLVQEPRHLHDLKEYPLASRPVPPELSSCTYFAAPNVSESWTVGEEGLLVRRHPTLVSSITYLMSVARP